jgi:hypothetical protein
MEDVDPHRAAIIRQHCTKEVTVNSLHPAVWTAMAAAANSNPDWRIMVQQAPLHHGGEVVCFLAKDDQMKLVGFWDRDGQTVTPDFPKLAHSVERKIWNSIGTSPKNDEYAIDAGFLLYWVPPLIMWLALLIGIPPIAEGFKEFRETPAYHGYWWGFVAIIYGISVYLWTQFIARFILYAKLGISEDFYLVEKYRWNNPVNDPKWPSFFRRWYAWTLSRITWWKIK